ncbi:MAG: hypothetical protein H7837_12295 [Magnetococcus sp. MYC-9]
MVKNGDTVLRFVFEILTESRMLDWTLHLLNHVWTPWVAAGWLLAWGVGHWFALQGNFFRPLHRQLVEMRRQLEESPEDPIAFAARFPEVEEPWAKHRLLTPVWNAFRKSLTLPAAKSPLPQPLYGNRAPGQFFNAEALMGGEVAGYYYRTIPNLLLGVGVLLTLIGLVGAIHFTIRSMGSDDLHATQSALMGLLNAASVKFLASIVGFALALLFSWQEKRHRRRLEQETARICQLWLERLEWSGDEQLGRAQLQASQAQTRQLREIADRLQQVITQPTFQAQGSHTSAEPLLKEGVVERLFDRLAGSLEPLRQTVLELGETLQSRLVGPQEAALTEQAVAATAVQTDLLTRIALRLEEGVPPMAGHAEAERAAQTARMERMYEQQRDLLAHLSHRMEQAVEAITRQAGTGSATGDLDRLLAQAQQDGERLMQAHAAAMGQLLESVGQQMAGLRTDASLAALHPDERGRMIDLLASRMEQAMAQLGDAGLSPFQGMANRLEGALDQLGDRLATLNRPLEMAPLVAALREEGERMQTVQSELLACLRQEWPRHAQGERPAFHPDTTSDFLDRLALQIEISLTALGEKLASGVPHGGGEALLRALRQEGARLVQANEEAMRNVVELVGRRFSASTATATLAELGSDEREGLLERVTLRMEQAVASLGEVGLAPFFDHLRREMAQIPSAGGQGLAEALQGSFARITQQLDSVTAALESRVWTADNLPDMAPLVRAIRSEGERLLQANEQALDRLFAELTQRSGMVPATLEGHGPSAALGRIVEQLASIAQTLTGRLALGEQAGAAGGGGPDWERLFSRIQQEGARLVQANETAMAALLSEVARRFAGVSATTALAELRPVERSELLDGVTRRMERAMTGLVELGLGPFLDGMRQEIGQLIQSNQQAVAQLVEEIGQRGDVRRMEESRLLENVLAQLEHAIQRMGERFADGLPQDTRQLSAEITQALQREGERLMESHQRLLDQLEGVLHPLAERQPAVAHPTGESGLRLDPQSLQPLLEGWRREGERLVLASEAAFARLLEEMGQQFAQFRDGEEVALLERLSGQLHHSMAVVRAPEVAVTSDDPEALALQERGELAFAAEAEAAGHAALRPLLAELTRILTRQRREEQRLLKQVVDEVNRAVAALDAKIGRATPLNMTTLVNTVHEQGERLFASVTGLAPTLAELTQVIARQRGEEMQLLERVAGEVNRAVAALDAKIGRATPLQLQRLVETVQDQGAKAWAGSQEIVRALRANRDGLAGTDSSPAPVTVEVGEPVVTARPKAPPLAVGMQGVHDLLAGLPAALAADATEAAVVAVEPPPPPPSEPDPRGTEGLLVSYRTPELQKPEESLPVELSWLRARAAAGRAKPAPVVEPFARLLPMLGLRPQGVSIPRPSPEEKRPLVVVAGRGVSRVQEVRASADGSLHPLQPTLLQEFGANKSRTWRPFTVFVAQQTAESLDSQKRFSP